MIYMNKHAQDTQTQGDTYRQMCTQHTNMQTINKHRVIHTDKHTQNKQTQGKTFK